MTTVQRRFASTRRPNVALAIAAMVGLLMVPAACRHKEPPPQPVIVAPPPLPPTSMTKAPASLPTVPPAVPPRVGPPGSEKPTVVSTPEKPNPPRRRTRKRVVPTDAAQSSPGMPAPTVSGTGAGTPAPGPVPTPQTAAPSSTAAASGPPPSGAAPAAPAPEPSLGQLSAGAGVGDHERAAMTETIRIQESRLSGIKHPLNEEAEAIAVQIRAFLAKAREAVKENDLDGARTLTTKAKVLLDELSSS